MKPGKLGFLVQTGNGLQYMPWIHIDDLCNIYHKAIEDTKMYGAYNAVSPQHITHRDFMHVLSRVMGKLVLPVPVPGFVLRILLGEMSDVILKGSRVSSNKITSEGYRFIFDNVEAALKNVIVS
jgi:NAD dependent epimerase/dehydratase family enzyme